MRHHAEVRNGVDALKVVVLRGNSGSGKSTVAQLLRSRVSQPMAIVEQDYLRRTVLKQRGNEGSAAKSLILQTVALALDHGYHVVLDGLLDTVNYGSMLQQVDARRGCITYAYWFDVPFDEALRRHASKPNSEEFCEAEMRQWWRDKALCGLPGEQVLPADSGAAPRHRKQRFGAARDYGL